MCIYQLNTLKYFQYKAMLCNSYYNKKSCINLWKKNISQLNPWLKNKNFYLNVYSDHQKDIMFSSFKAKLPIINYPIEINDSLILFTNKRVY